jgi:hypothetical protein
MLGSENFSFAIPELVANCKEQTKLHPCSFKTLRRSRREREGERKLSEDRERKEKYLKVTILHTKQSAKRHESNPISRKHFPEFQHANSEIRLGGSWHSWMASGWLWSPFGKGSFGAGR